MREASERDTATVQAPGVPPEKYRELQDRMVATFRVLDEFENLEIRKLPCAPALLDCLVELRSIAE